jgi:hypothetical protein
MHGKIASHLTSINSRILQSLVVTLLFAQGLQLNAQRITASVRGTVRDSTSAVIPNATVTVMNTGTRVTSKIQTNGAGLFDASSLPPGPYSVTVDAP